MTDLVEAAKRAADFLRAEAEWLPQTWPSIRCRYWQEVDSLDAAIQDSEALSERGARTDGQRAPGAAVVGGPPRSESAIQGSSSEPCPTCDGAKFVLRESGSPIMGSVPCPACTGKAPDPQGPYSGTCPDCGKEWAGSHDDDECVAPDPSSPESDD